MGLEMAAIPLIGSLVSGAAGAGAPPSGSLGGAIAGASGAPVPPTPLQQPMEGGDKLSGLFGGGGSLGDMLSGAGALTPLADPQLGPMAPAISPPSGRGGPDPRFSELIMQALMGATPGAPGNLGQMIGAL